jgi:hypothetical protein
MSAVDVFSFVYVTWGPFCAVCFHHAGTTVSVTVGNSAHDGNLAVQQNGLPFLMLPRSTESVERQNCCSLQWSITLAVLPTSLCNNMGGGGGGGGNGGLGWRSGKGAALLVGRSRDLFPVVSLDFSVTYFLPTVPWPWGRLSPYWKWVPGIFPGGEGGRCVRLTTSPPSCAECLKIWEPKPPGTLWATTGLLRDSFTLVVRVVVVVVIVLVVLVVVVVVIVVLVVVVVVVVIVVLVVVVVVVVVIVVLVVVVIVVVKVMTSITVHYNFCLFMLTNLSLDWLST